MWLIHLPGVVNRPHPKIYWWLPFNPVPTFLAISGFVIVQSRASSRSTGHFWWKRFLRIAPALAMSLVLTWQLLGRQAVLQSAYVYVTGGIYHPLPVVGNWPLWSLGYEEIAYLALCVAYAKGWIAKGPLIWGALGVTLEVGLGTNLPLANHAQFLPMCFMFGVMAYTYLDHLEGVIRWWHALAIYPIAILWVENPSPLLYGMSTLAGAVLALVLGITVKAAKSPPFDATMSVYVYHFPYLVAAWGWSQGDMRIMIIMSVLATVVVPATSWFCLEAPALLARNVKVPAFPLYSSGSRAKSPQH